MSKKVNQQADSDISNKHFKPNPRLETFLAAFDKSFHLPGPGGEFIKIAWSINTQKALIPFLCLILMVYFNNWSTGMWVYTALHGSYGMLWILKDRTFPDASFEQYISISTCIFVWIVTLGPYTLIPYTIAARWHEAAQEPSNERVFSAIILYAVGSILMHGADA